MGKHGGKQVEKRVNRRGQVQVPHMGEFHRNQAQVDDCLSVGRFPLDQEEQVYQHVNCDQPDGYDRLSDSWIVVPEGEKHVVTSKIKNCLGPSILHDDKNLSNRSGFNSQIQPDSLLESGDAVYNDDIFFFASPFFVNGSSSISGEEIT
jgi:hypothetical protein